MRQKKSSHLVCFMSHPWFFSHALSSLSTSSFSFTLLWHKNTQHNRHNKSNSENTQYIPQISKLRQSTSFDIKNHSVVKTCKLCWMYFYEKVHSGRCRDVERSFLWKRGPKQWEFWPWAAANPNWQQPSGPQLRFGISIDSERLWCRDQNHVTRKQCNWVLADDKMWVWNERLAAVECCLPTPDLIAHWNTWCPEGRKTKQAQRFTVVDHAKRRKAMTELGVCVSPLGKCHPFGYDCM